MGRVEGMEHVLWVPVRGRNNQKTVEAKQKYPLRIGGRMFQIDPPSKTSIALLVPRAKCVGSV